MKIIIVRHGETEANILRICQGQTHGKLNDEGISQAKKVAERLKNEKFDAIYSSDLRRALDTTKEIAKFHPHLSINTDKRLRERYFGSFQGQIFPEKMDEFTPSDEIETPEAIALRLSDFLTDIYTQHPDDTLLIVSHGFTIRTFFTIFYRISPERVIEIENMENTSVSIVTVKDDTYDVILKNDVSHNNKRPN